MWYLNFTHQMVLVSMLGHKMLLHRICKYSDNCPRCKSTLCACENIHYPGMLWPLLLFLGVAFNSVVPCPLHGDVREAITPPPLNGPPQHTSCSQESDVVSLNIVYFLTPPFLRRRFSLCLKYPPHQHSLSAWMILTHLWSPLSNPASYLPRTGP